MNREIKFRAWLRVDYDFSENPELIKIPNVETPGETNCMRKYL